MDRSAVTLERIASFVRAAERGNLSAVARELGIGQASVSRHIAELERALGVTLLARTTRSVTLTAEGAMYLERARRILRLLDEAADSVRAAAEGAGGRVRVSCTAALGVRHVCRLMAAFQDLHPAIDIELSLTDARIDLVRDGVDLAIRLGALDDSGLRRRVVGVSRRILVASPTYLAARGRPEVPADLAHHQAIRMTNLLGGGTLALRDRGGRVHRVAFEGRFSTDHGLGAREALIRDRGIALAHHWLIDDLLDSGAIERVLPAYEAQAVPLTLLMPPGGGRPARVRMLADAMTMQLARLPGISK